MSFGDAAGLAAFSWRLVSTRSRSSFDLAFHHSQAFFADLMAYAGALASTTLVQPAWVQPLHIPPSTRPASRCAPIKLVEDPDDDDEDRLDELVIFDQTKATKSSGFLEVGKLFSAEKELSLIHI